MRKAPSMLHSQSKIKDFDIYNENSYVKWQVEDLGPWSLMDQVEPVIVIDCQMVVIGAESNHDSLVVALPLLLLIFLIRNWFVCRDGNVYPCKVGMWPKTNT